MQVFVDGRICLLEGLNTTRRYGLGPQLLFLADNDGLSQEVFVNSIQFRNHAMTSAEIATLGGPSADGIPLPPPVLSITRAADGILLTWPSSPPGFQLERSDSLSPSFWTVVDTGTNLTHTIAAPLDSAYFRLKK